MKNGDRVGHVRHRNLYGYVIEVVGSFVTVMWDTGERDTYPKHLIYRTHGKED